jgi:hypothetical protein
MNTQTLLILIFGAGAAGLVVAASASDSSEEKYLKYLKYIFEPYSVEASYPPELLGEAEESPWIAGMLYGLLKVAAKKSGMSVGSLIRLNAKNNKYKSVAKVLYSITTRDLLNLAKAAAEVSASGKKPTIRRVAMNLLTSLEGGSEAKAEAQLNYILKYAKDKGFVIDLNAVFSSWNYNFVIKDADNNFSEILSALDSAVADIDGSGG